MLELSSQARLILGKKLGLIRENKSISMQFIAQRIEDNIPNISNTLGGKRPRSMEYLKSISSALGVSSKEFDELCLESRRDELDSHGMDESDHNLNGFALLSKQTGLPEADIRMMVEVIKKSRGL